MRDSIRIGSTGKLRVQFFDSDGVPIEATSVAVDLFEPGLDPSIDTPTLAAQTPTYLGNGVFELVFAGVSPGGTWHDKWTGDILGDTTETVQSFIVLSSGIINTYPSSGLFNNSLVEIILSSEISSLTGTSLGEDFSIVFSTTLEPLYSSVRKVRLDAGGLLRDVRDETINIAILEASLQADLMVFNTTTVNNNLLVHAKRQYVTCLAAGTVARNILSSGGVLKSKSLADFKVDYDNGVMSNLLNKLDDCASKWEIQLMAGGGARAIRNTQGFVKGENDPDRPSTGRGWYAISPGETPIGNSKYRNTGSRRWRTGWLSSGNKPGNDW